MAQEIGKLVPVTLNKIKQKGMYPDNGNLYLQVTDAGVKSWIFRYMIDGKSRSMRLSPLNTLSLADARMLAVRNKPRSNCYTSATSPSSSMPKPT